MHEYSVIQSLVNSVEAAVANRGTVHRIDVRIGDLSGVDCELLATAFDVFRAGTICEKATMEIERVPAVWACPQCKAPIERGTMLRCRDCNEAARLVSGDEIVLQRIELEVA